MASARLKKRVWPERRACSQMAWRGSHSLLPAQRPLKRQLSASSSHVASTSPQSRYPYPALLMNLPFHPFDESFEHALALAVLCRICAVSQQRHARRVLAINGHAGPVERGVEGVLNGACVSEPKQKKTRCFCRCPSHHYRRLPPRARRPLRHSAHS